MLTKCPYWKQGNFVFNGKCVVRNNHVKSCDGYKQPENCPKRNMIKEKLK